MSFSSWITKIFSKPIKAKPQKFIPLCLQSLEDRVTPALPFSTAFPTAISIVTNTGSSGAPANATAAFTVSFSDAVTGVDANDFSTVATGNVAVGSLEVSGSGNTYTVTAKGVTGNGTLGLNLNSDASISATASFAPQATFGVGFSAPSSVTMGDVNGDGKLDMVTANFSSDNVGVLLGNGNGTFGNQTTFAAGVGPGSANLGDVNGDGNLDIVVRNAFAGGIVSVLLGNGKGSFGAPTTFAAGNSPNSLTLGDVSGDGKLDIVTVSNFGANNSGANISVLLGDGKGAFAPPTTSVGTYGGRSVTLGDVNGDGKLDIVTANGGFSVGKTVSVFLNTGNGSFGPQATFSVGDNPQSLALGDVNGDNFLDIVTANYSSNNASVLLGDGKGAFGPQATFALANNPKSVKLGDVNGDNNLDIVTADGSTFGISNSASVLLGDGKGGFGPLATFAVGDNPISLALGDVDGNSRLDIVTANFGDNTLSLLLGNGNGTFANQAVIGPGVTGPRSMTLGDVNSDGKLDIITVNGRSNNASLFLGNGNGTFATQNTFFVGDGPSSVTLGDVNGDGKLDIVTGNSFGTNNISVLLGNGNGTFVAPATIAVAGGFLALGDVNADGKLDIVISGSVLLGKGDGSFGAPITFEGGSSSFNFIRSLSLGDVNSDGKLDIVTASNFDGSVLLGNGNGTFASPATFAFAGIGFPTSMALGDVNGDGKLDILTANGGYGQKLGSVLLGNGNGSFGTQTTFAVGDPPTSISFGDVNGDGKVDIVTANNPYQSNCSASVLLGNGNGTFAAPANFAVGDGPFSVKLGDVNGDGRLDIITGNYDANSVSVLLGNSSSSTSVQFAPQATFGVGFSATSSVTMGDVNGDKNLDIITANYSSNNVGILLGDGKGAFGPQTTFAAGNKPNSATLGDVNGDGNLDIVTAAGINGTASVLLGDGKGAFGAPSTFNTGNFPISLALGDVNGDGNLDIVTTANFSPNISVLLGNGKGAFGTPTTFVGTYGARSVTLGDVNGDNKLDIVTANGSFSFGKTASVLLNIGNGAFGPQATFSVGDNPQSLALGDVNGDNNLDIVTGNYSSNNASVLLGDGKGAFGPQATFALANNPKSVKLGDVNGDNILDIVTANGSNFGTTNSASVLLGDGKGGFGPQTTFAVGDNPNSLALGDVDGNSKLDIVTANSDNTLSLLLGNGNGTFANQAVIGPGVTGPRFMTLGDVNGDGKDDIITVNGRSNNASLFLGNGNGTFATQNTFFVGDGPSFVTVGDVNGDGKLDIVTGNSISNNISVLLGNGNGTFSPPSTIAGGGGFLALGDVNADGKLDIVTGGSVLLGNGDGSFGAPITFATGFGFFRSLSLGDVNGDGKLDIVIGKNFDGSILLGNGNGTFLAPTTLASGGGGSVALGDVNGDGKLDIVSANGNYGQKTATVLLGNGNGTFGSQSTYEVGGPSTSVFLGDVNGDGKLDIVTANGGGFSGNTASVLLGNGTGTFAAQAIFAVGDGPLSGKLGDVNGDGRLDIITGNYNTNSVSVLLNSIAFTGQTFNITNISPTIISASSATFNVGQSGSFTVTATGTPAPTISASGTLPTGVSFSSAGILSGTPTQGGTFNITITATNGVSPDATQAFALIVNAAATTTEVTSSTSPSIVGESISLTAEVIAIGAGAEIPTGTVNFFSGTKDLGFGTLNIGFAAISVDNLDLGTSLITAVYNGNATFKTSTSSPLEQIVTKATTTTTLTSNPNPSVLGQSTTLTATVTSSCTCSGKSPTGTVNFKKGEDVIGTGTLNASGLATISINSLQEGVVFITAEYSGDGLFDSSTGFTDQTVAPFGAATALGLTTSASNAVKGKAFGVQPVVTIKDAFGNTVANSTAAVTLTASLGATLVGTATVNAVNGVATFTNVGLDGNVGNYTLTYSSGSLTQGTQTILLESAVSPVVVGTTGGSSQGSTVSIVDPATGNVTGTVVPFPNFQGEVRVSAGDIDKDGKMETIAAAGPGGGPAINIIDSTGKTTAAFFAYDPAFTGGVFITVSDVNNDGFADIITGAGSGGGPHVKIFNGKDLKEIGSFFAYAEDFVGGVSVATADINGDGILDVVTGAGPGGGPHVKVFDGKSNSLISQWFAYAIDFTGGVFVGVGDIGNDGKFEVVTGAGTGGGPVVAVFDPFTGALQTQFFAYGESFTGGVRVGVSDGNADGVADLVTGAGPGGGPHVKGFNYPQIDLLFQFFSGPADDNGGVFVN